MKYLPKETCEYLVSLGCVSESGLHYAPYTDDAWRLCVCGETTPDGVPAFSLEDILRTENALKIIPAMKQFPQKLETYSKVIVQLFQDNPTAWPEEVAKLIKP